MNVKIIHYKWAGSWGPFTIKIPCGECGASEGVIKDVIKTEFPDASITFTVLPWLTTWWKPLLKGGWHAPIILVNGKVISQGTYIDRGLLAYHIRKELVRGYQPEGNVIFSKQGCPYCKQTKGIFDAEGIPYEDHDIIADPLALHQLFYLTKQFFPSNKPVEIPQVWLHGTYVGDSETIVELQKDGALEHYKQKESGAPLKE